MTNKFKNKKLKLRKSQRKSRKSKKTKRKSRKTKKRINRKKKHGAGQAFTRPQNQIVENNGPLTVHQAVAEPMPENMPLPRGTNRIPLEPFPSADAERIEEIPVVSPVTSINTRMDDIPDLTARVYDPSLYNTKIMRGSATYLYKKIYDSGIIEGSSELKEKIINALMNYMYHVNYVHPSDAEYNGHPDKIGDERELYIQLYYLIDAWSKNDGEIDNLLAQLRSDPDAEIGF